MVWPGHCYLPYLHLWVKSRISFRDYLEILGLYAVWVLVGLSVCVCLSSSRVFDFCVPGSLAFRVQRWKDRALAFKELLFCWRADNQTDDNNTVWYGCEEKIVKFRQRSNTSRRFSMDQDWWISVAYWMFFGRTERMVPKWAVLWKGELSSISGKSSERPKTWTW